MIDKKEHLKKYMLNYENINLYNLNNIFPCGCTFVMDTESSFKYDNGDIPIKIKNKKGKWIKNPNFNTEVHVYAWAVGNNLNDYVVYGTKLYDMFLLFEMISNYRLDLEKITNDKSLKQARKNLNFKCFVHNLGWDIEFCKYELFNHGFNYETSEINTELRRKINKALPVKSFNIVENDNIVYSAKIKLSEEYEVKYTKKKRKTKEVVEITEYLTSELNFLDSFKIMSTSLDNIAKNVVKIDDVFLKGGETYDYDSVRPVGHILTHDEIDYLYNDIYILKEWVKQFYEPLKTEQTTASSISFEKFIEGKFGYDKPYEKFVEHYPDLTGYSKVYKIITDSYKGGWTQANKKYVGKIVNCNNSVSIDINSSYPSVVKYKPLPYGKPTFYEGSKKLEDDELSIITICFDGFKNNDPNNLIGEIQVGSANTKIFNRKGTEYIDTNIVDGKAIGSNNKCDEYRYKLSLWNFELENMLENMTFYREKKVYNEILDIFDTTGELTEGYYIESTLVFKSVTGFFGDVVDEYTLMKIQGKEEGNATKESFAKLVLNSFYGKLASNPKRVERKLILNEKGMVDFLSTDEYYLADKKYYSAFSSCVTAWARVNLRTTLYKVGFNNVLYFDTDSLYTTLQVNEIKEKCGDILHKTELGKWDIEKEYTKFKAIGAKKYMLYGKSYGKDKPYQILCKCAGLPSSVREEQNFDTFYLGAVFTGKKVKTKVHGGYALIEGEYKLSDNAR